MSAACNMLSGPYGILTPTRDLALCRPMLAEDPAGIPFGGADRLDDILDTRPATGGA